MANGLPIDIDTFRNLKTTEAKLDALFDVLCCMYGAGYEGAADRGLRLQKCEHRFAVLESRKRMDTTVATGAGLLGGAIVWLIKWAMGK